ncbi:MAG: hypothetical protein OEL89_00030 [Candidatus Peregrinibacteria bacterium]|nr:hypothetical protein [Candidatus Peregrinibacteria bacterium]
METKIDENLGNEIEDTEIEEKTYPEREFLDYLPMRIIEDLDIPIAELKEGMKIKTTKDLGIVRKIMAGLVKPGYPPITDDIDLNELLSLVPKFKSFLAKSRLKSAKASIKAKRSPTA